MSGTVLGEKTGREFLPEDLAQLSMTLTGMPRLK